MVFPYIPTGLFRKPWDDELGWDQPSDLSVHASKIGQIYIELAKRGHLKHLGLNLFWQLIGCHLLSWESESDPNLPCLFDPCLHRGGQKQPRSMKAKQQSWVLRGLRHLQAPAAAHTDIFPEIGSNFFFQRSCCTICEVNKPTNKFSVQKIYDMLPSKVCPPPCFDVLTPIVWSKA